jgi:hypothetical protein
LVAAYIGRANSGDGDVFLLQIAACVPLIAAIVRNINRISVTFMGQVQNWLDQFRRREYSFLQGAAGILADVAVEDYGWGRR